MKIKFENVYKKSGEGFFSTFFYDRLSVLLLKLLPERTPITPNQMTILSFFFAILSAAYFALGTGPGFVIGTIFLQLFFILDCADGQLARLKNLQSKTGNFLDHAGGPVVIYLIYLGICWGIYKQFNEPWALLICFLTIFTVIMICHPWESVLWECKVPKPERTTRDVTKGCIEKLLGTKGKLRSNYVDFGYDVQFFLILVGGLLNPVTPQNMFNSMIVVLIIIIVVGNIYWIVRFLSALKYIREYERGEL